MLVDCFGVNTLLLISNNESNVSEHAVRKSCAHRNPYKLGVGLIVTTWFRCLLCGISFEGKGWQLRPITPWRVTVLGHNASSSLPLFTLQETQLFSPASVWYHIFSLCSAFFFLLISPIFNFYYLLMHWSTFVREWCLLSKNGQQLVNQSPYAEVQRCALLCAHWGAQKKLHPLERKVVPGCLQIWRQS